jgi:hypothetical protein
MPRFSSPDITAAAIILNDTNLRQLLFGTTGAARSADAAYTRAEIEAKYLP